jgi:hypothetical protein
MLHRDLRARVHGDLLRERRQGRGTTRLDDDDVIRARSRDESADHDDREPHQAAL